MIYKAYFLVLFSISAQQRINSYIFFYSDHRFKTFYQFLVKEPRCLRLDSRVLPKEDLVVCSELLGQPSAGRTPYTARRRLMLRLTGSGMTDGLNRIGMLATVHGFTSVHRVA